MIFIFEENTKYHTMMRLQFSYGECESSSRRMPKFVAASVSGVRMLRILLLVLWILESLSTAKSNFIHHEPGGLHTLERFSTCLCLHKT
ncbi:hypothetical protein COCSUDRAFT_34624 [Coccomyxa subellipsoidea C-169]|uniref:Uncharacterized protein n=1 Tax=Coccomyxa subellipsoidea (strain C-169) TaxID=574566 RepID=I0YI46_COCSC|nr:hypothetical protein COCSUDRAFT_34624 [Coccomyxa subellipsoidea C-169]EIE18065.1 hypothetical protein COCSUDRAFT_34624 [Coccomyxa subellipsoidea C-169]|eukprot:XP_005642609.1 hypothetical protein COCSUDRAFT_34624 [Coccomyxa subellipsoidea C-169]